MRFLAWNILHGGARRTPEIALGLLHHAPDVIVLSEFRSTMGGQLRAILSEHGWEHQLSTEPARGVNGMLVASRRPLRRGDAPPPPSCPGRWLHAALHTPGAADLHILAVHAPDGHGDRTLQTAYWRHLLDAARPLADQPCVVLGDFNTGRHRADEAGRTFACTPLLGQFCTLGFTDAWRHTHPQAREFTWFSHTGNGFRIDAAYVSRPLLEHVASASYAHDLRSAQTSDHAPVLLDLAPSARFPQGNPTIPPPPAGHGTDAPDPEGTKNRRL